MKALVGLLILTGLCPLSAPAQTVVVGSGDGGGARGQPVSVETAPRPVAHATRVSLPVNVDGRLDEPAWSEADSLGGFVQSQPNAGYPATEPTVVRVVYDDEALYIGALMYDSAPEQMVVSSLEKDFPGGNTRDYDIFSFTLDTFHDRKDSFIYLVNPYGAVRDGQTFDDSRDTNFAWDGTFRVKTEIHDWGWSMEMAIPWTSLRFNPTVGGQVWGFNMLRRVRRKNEDSYWAPLDRRDPVHRMSKAGTLDGLSGLPASRNLAITPYAAAGASGGRSLREEDRGGDFDGGFDVKYGVTPKLTLDLTYNTDFSQVEVDQEQVNLTRFSVFFPEQRDFFVENSGVFTFGDVSERGYRMGASLRDFTLFHSRRIGLRSGAPVPILGGGRLTGRVGGFEVGLLDMQTEGLAGVPAENFAVARLRRNLFGVVDVGGIAINRQSTDGLGAYNRSWGVDASARVLGNLIVSSYLAGTDAEGVEVGGKTASRLTAAWRDQLWDASVMHKRVGAGFDPGVGYVRRTGVNHTYATLGAFPRPALRFLQEINPYVEGDYITGPGGLLETRTGTAGLGATFSDGATFGVDVSDRYERLLFPFAVSGDAVVPAGTYGYREGTVRYQLSQGRPLSAGVTLSGGEFFDGDRRSLGINADWRVNYRVTFELRADHNDISLPGEDFTADVYGARLRYSHSTRLFGSAFVQYNQALEQTVTNLRLNLIHSPLSDFFLVYTERRGVGGLETGVLDRLLTAKVTKMVAF